MNNHNGISGGQLMLAFIAGAVTGAAVALLASPQSGPQVRESIKGWATDAQGCAANRVPETLKSAYGRASRAAKNAFSKELDREAEASSDIEMPSEVQAHDA